MDIKPIKEFRSRSVSQTDFRTVLDQGQYAQVADFIRWVQNSTRVWDKSKITFALFDLGLEPKRHQSLPTWFRTKTNDEYRLCTLYGLGVFGHLYPDTQRQYHIFSGGTISDDMHGDMYPFLTVEDGLRKMLCCSVSSSLPESSVFLGYKVE
jgi:hypothetical protein